MVQDYILDKYLSCLMRDRARGVKVSSATYCKRQWDTWLLGNLVRWLWGKKYV